MKSTIRSLLGFLILVPATLSATMAAAQAQKKPPQIGYVFPAGGRQGDSVHVTFGGQYFAGKPSAIISGTHIKATLVEQPDRLTPRQAADLREQIQQLRKKPKTPEIRQQIELIADQLSEFQNRRTNPALADRATFQFTIDPDAELGQREVRLATKIGLSNPLVFQVGQLAEFQKTKSKDNGKPIDGKRRKDPRAPKRATPEPEMDITLPVVVNGQTMPGGVDRYRFQARKGQRLVVAVSARELMPYLADAVPGWFQAAASIQDANGNELAYDDHYRFRPDPVLYCRIPNDGPYVLEIRDALYRGRDDFVYRVALGELPYLTGIFPLGGPLGEKTTVELTGWNLHTNKRTIDAANRDQGILPVSTHEGKLISNHVPFALDTLPECLEQEPNDPPDQTQPVMLPIMINGRIDRPGDCDRFRFDGRAGTNIVVEVDARNLDSPLDSMLTLTDVAGHPLASNDDNADKGAGLMTHHADSLLAAALPADGTYILALSDVQHKGGVEYAYRLRISESRPDFALRVVPSSINVRAGASAPMTVHVLRRDGFAGQIDIVLNDAPEGFAISGGLVPANQDRAEVTLTVPRTPQDRPIALRLEGRATIQGKEIVRQAVPADDMMQAFIYHHLVPAQSLLVAVVGR